MLYMGIGLLWGVGLGYMIGWLRGYEVAERRYKNEIKDPPIFS